MVACLVSELFGVCPTVVPAQYIGSLLLEGCQVDSLHTGNLRSKVTAAANSEREKLTKVSASLFNEDSTPVGKISSVEANGSSTLQG